MLYEFVCSPITCNSLGYGVPRLCFDSSHKQRRDEADAERRSGPCDGEKLKNCRELVKVREGRVRITLTREELKDQRGGAVLFISVKGDINKVVNPPLEDIRPAFQEWTDEVEFSMGGRSVWSVRVYLQKRAGGVFGGDGRDVECCMVVLFKFAWEG